MEESTGKDETLVRDISDCTLAESDDRTKGRVQGSFKTLEGDSCNRGDLMVEVLGSEVYVGGVCSSGSGENFDHEAEETSQGKRGDASVVVETPENESVDGDGCGEDVYHVAGTENGGSLVVSELLERKDQVSFVDETREVMEDVVVVVVEDAGRERVMIDGGDEAQNMESCGVAGCTGVEMEINNVPNVELVAKEVGVERETHEVVQSMSNNGVCVQSGASLDRRKQEMKVEKEKEKAQNPSVEEGDGVGGPLLGSQVSESQVVDEVDEMESEESRSRLTIKGVEEDSKMAHDEVDASKDSVTESVGVSDKAWNPRIGAMTMNSGTVENSGAEIEVREENFGVMNHGVCLNPLNEQCQVAAAGDIGGWDKDDCLKSGKYQKEGVASDVSPVSSNTMKEVGFKQETSDVSSHGDPQVVFENQQETWGKMSELMEKGGPVDEDTTIFGQPTLVIGAEATPSGDGVPCSVNEGAMLSAENTQAGTAGSSTEMDDQVSDYRDSAQNTDEVMISEMEILERPDRDQKLIDEGHLDKGVTIDSDMSQRNAAEEIFVDQVTDPDEFGFCGDQDSIAVEVPDGDQPPITFEEKMASCESLEPESCSSMQKPSYELLPEDEYVFSVPDLVWGKVKNHPWWPGRIFDFTDASEKAMKHHKRDCLLVAYFGDRTFAWNEESTLKSFRTHFSQMVAQCNGETFNKAVYCALEEVSRRVELSLACPCIPKASYDNIRVQVVENAGIRLESSRREVEDESVGVSFLQPDKLVKYIRAMAKCPMDGSDDLGLTIAKAQILAFGRFRGYCSLPEFQFYGDLVENDTAGPRFQDTHPGDVFDHPLYKDDEETSSSQEIPKANNRPSLKRKHNLRNGIYPKVKEKSLSELMSGTMEHPDDHVSGKRRKNTDKYIDDSTAQDGRKTISLAKVSSPPKQSFKIGECISRIASEMTGSPRIKGNTDSVHKLDGTSDRPTDGNDISLQSSAEKAVGSMEYSTLDELFLQLRVIAQDPLKRYDYSNVIVRFFSDLRNAVIGGHQYIGAELWTVEKVGGKRKKNLPETFEFDDVNDAYWTDMVIENGVEEQPPRRSRKKDNQLAIAKPEKTHQEGRRPYNRKRYSTGDHAATPEKKPPGYISENAPTELIMNFSDVRSVPSESNLNKMFRRFGPLKETETEVDRESSRARVVFKKCSDAEVAFNSAGKFNIFGPILVNYELNYTPTVQYTPAPLIATLDQEMQLDLSTHDHEMQLDLSIHEHEMHLDLSAHDHEMQIDLSNLSAFEVNLV